MRSGRKVRGGSWVEHDASFREVSPMVGASKQLVDSRAEAEPSEDVSPTTTNPPGGRVSPRGVVNDCGRGIDQFAVDNPRFAANIENS